MLASSRVFATVLRPSLLRCSGRDASTWKIMASAIVDRPPVIVKKFNALEKAYLDLLLQQEVATSLLSDHELRAREEKEAAAKQSKGTAGALIRVKLAEDLVKEYQLELEEFWKKYADKSEKNLSTDNVDRCLDHTLTLLVLQKIGDKSHWLFPQAENVEGETLRQTAERAVTEFFGDSVQIQSLGNAPIAYYKYKFPEAVQKETGHEGAKVFFMRSDCKAAAGAKLNKERGSELMWATHEEMMTHLPAVVSKAVRPAMFQQHSPDFTRLLDFIIEKEEFRKRKIIGE